MCSRLGRVERALNSCAPTIRLEVVDECASTNAWLAARAERGAPAGAAVVCELQRAGRGRRGASWFSGLGTSLTFSILWRFDRGAAALGGLSLAAGVACARALDSLGIRGVALKWPNDLMLDGAKLGGILVEISGEPHGPTAAVAGIGINMQSRPSGCAARSDSRSPTLLRAARTVARNLALARLLAELARRVRRLRANRLRPVPRRVAAPACVPGSLRAGYRSPTGSRRNRQRISRRMARSSSRLRAGSSASMRPKSVCGGRHEKDFSVARAGERALLRLAVLHGERDRSQCEPAHAADPAGEDQIS